jgi:putative toxin-antitoxin system antitoxin component (TIGR02293 family)
MDAAAPELSRRSVYGFMSAYMGVVIDGNEDALRLAEQGIPAPTFKRAQRLLGFPTKVIGSPTSIRSRLSKHRPLTVSQSERFVRVLRTTAEAEEFFGDGGVAIGWMKRPARYLQDAAPITPFELASSDDGARLLENLLRSTSHGMF